ncbi:ricin-type beta-trefoil lectin domain protein [Lentzea sp. CA-135723]|uniref:ricin-type beta-trefoil lectin domain protein n=1 Tax=Lentzea sp. CA-135723 TaxID=3239950 RepID=UPI003D920A64
MKRRSSALFLALLVMIASVSTAQAAAGPPVSQDAAMYPRAVRLAHNGSANGRVLLTTTGFPGGGPVGAISESTDGGATYRRVGTVADPEARSGLCCTTLFELPRQVGSLAPGTLLWAGSAGQDAPDRRMSLRVWRSNDVGRTWSLLATAVRAAGTGGLWEPEFSVDASGRLVLHFADEGQPGRSQVLARAVSTDGVQWTQRTTTVAGTASGHRPGMASVRRLPSGTYLMAYEVCGFGGQFDCAVRYRTSPNGWDWGDPADLGPLARTQDGRYLVATPTLAVTSSGRVLLVGQRVLNANGSTAALNGLAMFAAGQALDSWTALPVPVAVPGARPGVCPNYSPTLVPLDDDRVAQVTTDAGADGVCRAYAGAAALPPTTERTGALRAVGGTCVDAAAGGGRNGDAVQLWTCNTAPVQRWTWRPDGSLTVNGRCLDVPGGATAAGTPLQIWDCNGLSPQQWLHRPDGTLINPLSGRCLDSPDGATANGTRLRLWDCNGSPAQRVEHLTAATTAAARPAVALRYLMIIKPSSTAPGWGGQLSAAQVDAARNAFLTTWPRMVRDLTGGSVFLQTSVQVSPDPLTSSSAEGIIRPEDVGGDTARWVHPGEWDGVLMYGPFRNHSYWTLGGTGPHNTGWSSVNARDDLGYHQDALAGWTHEALHALAQFYFRQLGTGRAPQCADDPGRTDGVHCAAAYGYDQNSGNLPYWLGWYRDYLTGRIANGAIGLGDPTWSRGNRRENVLRLPAGATIPRALGGVRNALGRCLDVAAGGQLNATAVQLWDCNTAPVQQWAVETDGTVRAMGRCLDVPGGQTGNGTPLWVYDCNGSVFQQWVPRADGSLLNPNSGRCLDVPGGQGGNGTRLQIHDCNGAPNQRWTTGL